MNTLGQVINEKDLFLQKNLQINIIHNRFDLLYDDFVLYDVDGIAVPVYIKNNEASVGLYLTSISDKQLSSLTDCIFSSHPEVSYIIVSHSYTKLPWCHPQVYWHINLPESIEQFDATLSSKLRYNVKWYPKKLKKECGDYVLREYTRTDVPLSLIEQYFIWKEGSHMFRLNSTPECFLREYGISTIYALYLSNKPIAVGFSCETGDISYFENFSYNPQYHLFSPGMILYHYIIEQLIKKSVRKFYLSGGELDYKRRYNGVRTQTYTGRIFRDKKRIPNALSKYHLLSKFLSKKLALKLVSHLFLPREYRRTLREFVYQSTMQE